jgi:hypothetical protein
VDPLRLRGVRTEELDLRRNLDQGTHRHVLARRFSPPERGGRGNPAPYIRHPTGSDARVLSRHVGKVLLSFRLQWDETGIAIFRRSLNDSHVTNVSPCSERAFYLELSF